MRRVLACAVVVLTACGGGGGGGPSTSVTTPTPSASAPAQAASSPTQPASAPTQPSVLGSIAGTVTAPSGAGLPGVQLTLSGGNSASTVSDAGGNYSFPALATGNYVVIPSAAGASFAPQTLSVTVNGQATSGVSFARTAQSYESTQFIAEYMAVLHGQTLSTFAANEKALFRQTAASGQTGAYYTASAND